MARSSSSILTGVDGNNMKIRDENQALADGRENEIENMDGVEDGEVGPALCTLPIDDVHETGYVGPWYGNLSDRFDLNTIGRCLKGPRGSRILLCRT
jgi:hypothetical protein